MSGDAKLVGDVFIPQKPRKGSAIVIETGLSLNRHGIFAEFARYFAEHGFVTVVYDKRSHNDSSGEFSCALLRQDLLNVINHVSKMFKIKRFGLFGFCYGGIASMELTPDEPRVKVFCGVSTYPDYLELVLGKRKALPFFMRLFHRFGDFIYKRGMMKYLRLRLSNFHISPLENGVGFHGDVYHLFKELAECDDPLKQVRKIKKPFFLFYGEKDRLVPSDVTQRLFNTCPSRNKKLFTYDEAGHFFKAQRAEMLNDCLKIYKKYLKG